jgi:general secretion pathway protein G
LKKRPLATFLGSEGHLFAGRRSLADNRAFTVLELLLVVAIMLTLAAMSVPVFGDAIEAVYIGRAIGDIRTLQTEITRYEVQFQKLPDTLQEVGVTDLLDPWGNPYEYLNYENAAGLVQPRKDKFLKPVNSTYDIYSKGPDGDSKIPFTANASKDDIVRANDGAFIGIADEF